MQEKSHSIVSSLILGIFMSISLIGSVFLFTNYKLTVNNTISATGSAELDFETDLIVWRGRFIATGDTSKEAYDKIKVDAETVKTYLENNSISDSEMVFSSVDVRELTESIYDDSGRWRGERKIGYELRENVTITSNDIDKVEKVSRDISELLSYGVEFVSEAPEYYCTTLSDTKLKLIEEATKNAKERIDIMAKEAGAKVSKLKNSRLGVFQIVAKNSGTSNFAYDGYFDTSSRSKTASITVRLEYGID